MGRVIYDKKLMNSKAFVIFGALFCCALWGISTPIVKMGYEHIDASHIPSLLLWVGFLFIAAGILTVGIYSIFQKNLCTPKKKVSKGL